MTLTSALPRAVPLAAALLLTALAAPAAAQPAADRTVLSAGHADAMQVYLDGDSLALRVKDDTGDAPVLRHPDDVLFQVLPRAEVAIPSDWGFLGDPGDPMWMLPFNQDHDLLWPGWSTEPIKNGRLQGDTVELTLESVEGPGEVALWNLTNFGAPNVFFNSRDGGPDSIAVRANSHVHAYWGFTAEGEYTLTWKASGTLADGTPVASASYDYRWVVGELPDEDPGDPDPGGPDPGGPTAPDLDGRLVLDRGHVDVFAVKREGAALALGVKDDTGLHADDPVHRDPDDVVFHATPESELAMTQAQIDYWGVGDRYTAGDAVWWLPSAERQGVLFPGWSTDVPGGELRDDTVSLDFTAFSGPGDLLMFMPGDGIVEPTLYFADTADGLPDAITAGSKTHAHADWLFSAPGVYTLTWQAEAVLADGTPISSEPEEYVFVVGEWPADDPDNPDNPELEQTQTITATVDTDAGGLVISVDPNDRDVVLPPMALNSTATRWATEGELRPVTVTDTRSADPGWNAAAQVSAFTGDSGGFSGSHLGWLPGVVSSGDSQRITPGAVVQGALDGGPGLATSQILAAAAPGAGKGTCVLGADLQLALPTDLESGTYTALVTFTAI